MLTARTVSMGNARGALKDRGNDVYETPPVAVEALLRVESLPPHIWEPCCGGSGRIVEVLRAHGHQVSASDLIADRIDFLMERRAPAGVGAIVTNPPYKLADQLIRHGPRAGADGRDVAAPELPRIRGAARSDRRRPARPRARVRRPAPGTAKVGPGNAHPRPRPSPGSSGNAGIGDRSH